MGALPANEFMSCPAAESLVLVCLCSGRPSVGGAVDNCGLVNSFYRRPVGGTMYAASRRQIFQNSINVRHASLSSNVVMDSFCCYGMRVLRCLVYMPIRILTVACITVIVPYVVYNQFERGRC